MLLLVLLAFFDGLLIHFIKFTLRHGVVGLRGKVNQFNALCRVLRQEIFDQLLAKWCDGLVLRELDRIVPNHLRQFALILRVKWQRAVYHRIEHDAECPDVYSWTG